MVASLMLILVSCQDDCTKADKLRLQNKFDEAVELYQKAADEGNAYALWRLSKAYENGDGVDFDKKKASELLIQAAENGCEEAKCDLAYAYMFGSYSGIEINFDKGKRMLESLAKNSDNTYVIVHYAYFLLEDDDNFEKNEEKAVSLLDKAKEKKNPAYLELMGRIYLNGADNISIDENKAIDLFTESFKKGNRQCAHVLAAIYWNGQGCIKADKVKAIEWMKRGIESNNKGCMRIMAQAVYLSDDTALADYHHTQKGVELLKKAARHGDGEAYYILGNLYSDGELLPKDDKKAFKNWEQAAFLKDPQGANNLAYAYRYGIGCEKNEHNAVELYKQAVEWGSGFAANKLFYIYLKGELGLKADKKLAKEYLLKAADYGDDWGCYNLGLEYYHGNNLMSKNTKEAFVYMKMAADNGNVKACDWLSYFYENGIGCEKDPQKAKVYRDKTTAKDDDKDYDSK